jgi:thymidine phosphorylase
MRALTSGAAAQRFARMVTCLGGPADLMERPDAYLARAPVVEDVPAPRGGFVTAIDTRALGLAVIALGGGRTSPEQAIDPAVGFDRFAPLGARIAAAEPLARVHAASREAAQAAAQSVARAYTIGDAAAAAPVLIERIA